MKTGNKPSIALSMRFPISIVKKVDDAVKAQRLPTNRTKWIIEAVLDRLDREDEENRLRQKRG